MKVNRPNPRVAVQSVDFTCAHCGGKFPMSQVYLNKDLAPVCFRGYAENPPDSEDSLELLGAMEWMDLVDDHPLDREQAEEILLDLEAKEFANKFNFATEMAKMLSRSSDV